MTERQSRTALPTHPFLLILLAGAILYLGLGFVRQASVSRQRSEELDQIKQEIVTAQEELARAEATREEAQSPRAAEEWARENGWTKPDEALVVIPLSEHESPAAAEDAEEGIDPISTREAWWELLFGTR
jgi:hypothetical protein